MLTLDSVLSSSTEALESAVESRLCMTHFREGVGEFLSDAQKEATSKIRVDQTYQKNQKRNKAQFT